jgi:hypothetical protein
MPKISGRILRFVITSVLPLLNSGGTLDVAHWIRSPVKSYYAA